MTLDFKHQSKKKLERTCLHVRKRFYNKFFVKRINQNYGQIVNRNIPVRLLMQWLEYWPIEKESTWTMHRKKQKKRKRQNV